MNVKGQAALVTGGGSGLGAATAKALAAAGAKVALLDVDDGSRREVAEEIGGIAIALRREPTPPTARGGRRPHGAARGSARAGQLRRHRSRRAHRRQATGRWRSTPSRA